MNSDEWLRLREILESALELPAAGRRSFLDQHCPPDLRADVDELIAAASAPDALLDSPVTLAEAILPPGTRIGAYEILDALGSGGAGVVYRARDTRLGRQVAVKLLPFGDRTTTALAEARAVSSLNHPNIVTLYDVIEHAGSMVLVMELVPGRTLADVLEDGPLLPAAVARFANDIAGALAAAHAAGLLHRDLKPGNVMIRSDNVIKVLDFGIAQSSDDAAIAVAPAGTRRYMSPEQAAGAPLDRRSDIYALGRLCREMLLGARAPEDVPIPGAWKRVIDRATAVRPQDRYADVDEFRSALVAGLDRPARRWRTIAALAALVMTTGVILWPGPYRRDAQPLYTPRQIDGVPNEAAFPAISPDGRRVAYSVGAGAQARLFLHEVTTLNPTPLNEAGRQPDWSPDGRRLAFRSERDGGGLFVLDTGTSRVAKLTDRGYLPAWSPDGTRLAFSTLDFDRVEERPTTNSSLAVVNVADGAVTPVRFTGAGIDAIQPAWSPDGRRLAFWSVDEAGRRNVWTVAAEGGTPVAVTTGPEFDWGPRWSPSGMLYWSSDRDGVMSAWRVRVDLQSGRPMGQPALVGLPTPYAAHFSFAGDGTLAYATPQVVSSVWRVGLDRSTPPRRLTPTTLRLMHPSVSPDDKWLVAFEQDHFESLVILQTDGTGLRRLTSGAVRDRGPSWSPDGKTIAFGSNRGGEYRIWRISPDGTGLTPFAGHPTGAYSPEWAPDSERIAWFARGYLPFVTGPTGDEALPMPSAEVGFRPMSWSPDGIAGLLRAPDGRVVGSAVYSIPTRTYRRLRDDCGWIRWQPASARLVCGRASELLILDARTGLAIGPPIPLPHPIADMSSITADGRAAYIALGERLWAVWVAAVRY